MCRRWMPWVLLAVLLLFSQLALWGSYFAYRTQLASGGQVVFGTGGPGERGEGPVVVNCNDLKAGNTSGLPPDTDPRIVEGLLQQCEQAVPRREEQLENHVDSFVLPGSLSTILGFGQMFGLILLAILAASTVGTEYGWGTVRTVLARGTGRAPYLAGKLALLALVGAAGLVVLAGVTSVSSLVAGALAGVGIESSGWGHAANALGKTWSVLVVYTIVTSFVTVLTRSAAAGMAMGLGYFFAEQIIVAIFSALFDWFPKVADYFLIRNITEWGGGFALQGPGLDGNGGSEIRALLVLAAYTVVSGLMAFWLFRRRDLTSTTGG
ncbi:MAG: ABC transporter permease subunit [Chloroflexi bacterium]|nr:ABC transporter permease subunit [Chloroflexota bacterium]